uniref:Uncharacterized protein isoform X3 n=2 Tax=Nicotiana TaxID=4085 RepID=A0A1S3XFM8_TOBAC|nr:PREDICTED: uncharacterized protein LOC104239283 isoform X3 [Nicotiana sylvestris]XP_016438791.1 PREDICTED: uncharacterized protein LOC107764700 isoform X3 [Nicotiana tabacum]
MLPFPNAPLRRLVLLLRFNRLSQLYPNLRSLPNELLPPLPSNFWRHLSLIGPVCWPLEVGDGGLFGPVVSSSTSRGSIGNSRDVGVRFVYTLSFPDPTHGIILDAPDSTLSALASWFAD